MDDLVDGVGLEYDVGGNDADAPSQRSAPRAPSAFLSFRPGALQKCRASDLCDFTLAVLRKTTVRNCSPVVDRCVRACFAQLPVDAGIRYVAFMNRGVNATIRLCVQGLRPSNLPQYLASTAGVVCEQVQTIGRLATWRAGGDGDGGPTNGYLSFVSIDIGSQHGFVDRAGIERAFVWAEQQPGILGNADGTLMRDLVRRGWCAESKRRALLEWPGRSVAAMPHDVAWHLLSRRINHVKFVVDSMGHVDVKCYFGVVLGAYRAAKH